MNEAQVRAIFTLAGFEVTSLTKVENPYWPRHKDYDEVRNSSPWWVASTGQGYIVIGWRKRVIHIDWARMGVVFPLTDQEGRDLHSDKHFTSENVTHWETGTHAYGYGKAVEYLTILKNILPRVNYLKEYWNGRVEKPEDMIEWEVQGILNHWENPSSKERITYLIKAKNKSDAILKFYNCQIFYKMEYCRPRQEMIAMRKQYELEEPKLTN